MDENKVYFFTVSKTSGEDTELFVNNGSFSTTIGFSFLVFILYFPNE